MTPAMLCNFRFGMQYSDFIQSAVNILGSKSANPPSSFPGFLGTDQLECFPPDRSRAILDGSFKESDAIRYAAAFLYRLLTGTSPYTPLERSSDFWHTERTIRKDCFDHQIFALLPSATQIIKRHLKIPNDIRKHLMIDDFRQLNLQTPFGKLKSFIAKGATSCVYSITMPDGREAALKLSSEKYKERLKREYAALSANRHRNIIRTFSYSEINGVAGMTMELLTGERTSANHETELAKGLSHLHKNGIIHGDVKHANTGLTTDGRAVIFDLSHMKSEIDSNKAVTLELEKLKSVFSTTKHIRTHNAVPPFAQMAKSNTGAFIYG